MNTLNVIDISDHQAGLSLPTMFEKNPDLDAVIVKATEGTGYVNAYCDPWIQWLIKNDKPWGFYHYLSGTKESGAVEADYFYKHCLNYFGHGIAICDLEANAINRGPEYAKQFLDRIYELSGVRAMLYMSLSVVHSFGTGSDGIVSSGYKLWLAQYASMQTVYGFKKTPWQSGSVAPWPRITMHQYTANGRLNGYIADLDLDIFYGTKEDWKEIASSSKIKPKPQPEPEPEPTPDPEPAPKPDIPTGNKLQVAIGLLEYATELLKEYENSASDNK